MANKCRVNDLDFVYISYMEPNKEQNWADLKNKVPWAKRVDGVKGFDSAHKAAAELAETDFFISVDGDNVIDESFLLETLDFTKTDRKAVHRWRARNSINNLVYGNGGLVGWDKETCLNMHTHENAKDKKAEIDFCWTVKHENLHNCYSTSVINSEPFQAWIAGYREGVKMSLDRGARVPIEEFKKNHWKNLNRMYIWQMVGADVENGIWAVYGARQGTYMTMCTDWNIVHTRDFEYLNEMWRDIESKISLNSIEEEIIKLGNDLIGELDIPISPKPLDPQQSSFFKKVYKNPSRGVESFISKE